jgi:tetratricopeptide (TPR) repeat protein
MEQKVPHDFDQQNGSPATRPARPASPRARSRSQWQWPAVITTVAVLAAAAIVAYQHLSLPLLPVPVPKDVNGLEPQLRAYVAEKVAWVRESPRDSRRQATLGLVYAANGLWPEAKLAFQNAVQLDPREPLARLYLAVSHQETGDQDGAVLLLRDLTARYPDFAPGQYRLGDTLLRMGQPAEAARCFQRLIKLAPKEWRGYAGLGSVRLQEGKAAEAATLLEQAVRIDPSAKPARHPLGQAYQRLGRTNEARRELALGMNALHYPMPDAWSVQAPQHMRLLYDLVDMAQQYAQMGYPEKGVLVLEKALPFNTNNPHFLVSMAMAYNSAGQPEKARPLLEHSLQLNANSMPAYVALSASCLALGLTNEALTNAERAMDLAPNHAHPYLAKASVLLALERDTDAVNALEAAHRCDPKNAQILVDLGDAYLRNLDQPQKALALFKQAIELDPTALPVYVRLAKLQHQLGDEQAAQTSLDTARELAPDEPALAALQKRLRKSKAPLNPQPP